LKRLKAAKCFLSNACSGQNQHPKQNWVLSESTEAYFETRQLPKLLATIINQANPRFTGQQSPLPISRQQYPDNDDNLSSIIRAVKAMDETCLCIQGPPGAGKTYTAEKVIRNSSRTVVA
jgi:uncharacterized protein